MRLHRLEATAFGPFAGTVAVDLDAVSEGGLFLIRGATGAGKTSLLDAVCFALYADVPGARSRKGLHSDHAEPGLVPTVLLELTAAGRRLRLERSPEFTRPKARGTGEVTVPARGSLSELRGGRWHVVSTRQDEIGEVVREVLGLGMEQFSKVVLLPQGDFAAFLRASPEERRGLLERLFDVSAYAELEEWFATRRRESATALERQSGLLAADLAAVTEVVAGLPEQAAGEPRDWHATAVEELVDALEQTRVALDATVSGALAERDAAALADSSAAEAHRAASEVAASRRRGATARSRLATLEEQRAAHESAVQQLDRATRAASVRGHLGALDRAGTVLDTARQRLDTTAKAVLELGMDDPSEPALCSVLPRLGSGERRIDEAELRAAAVKERTRRRDALRRRVEEATARAARSGRDLETASTARIGAQAALDSAVEEASGVGAAQQEVATLSELCALRRDQVEGLAREQQLRSQLATARDGAQDLRQHYLDLRQARLEAMAAELAGALVAGEPCSVCGSSEHPAPASTAEVVPAEQVETAEAQWRAAEAGAAQVGEAVAAVAAAVHERTARLEAAGRDLATLDRELTAARARLATLESRASALAALRAAAELAVRDVEATRAAAEATSADLAASTSALRTVEADLAAEESGLRQALADHAAQCPCGALAEDPPTQARRRHEQASTAVQAHLLAHQQLARSTSEHEAATQAVEVALAEAGLDDEATARAGLLPAAQVEELARLTAAYQTAWDSAQATLREPDVVAALEAPEPDLVALAAARDEARSRLVGASSQEALLRRGLDGLDRARAGVAQRCGAIAEASAEHVLVRELADALGGGGTNTLRMRLSAFVLAARLEKVAALANERLAAMGDGRYQLRHTDAPAARGARSGLGLEVLDLWTGQARDTASLSGGESFMASLALALGLADAVREESGGFDLQTLFVDEGFGTLDDDTLEQVMGVLDGLREGGRAVGVVSHVAELHTRIPSQVVVDKTERGSSVTVTVDGAGTAA